MANTGNTQQIIDYGASANDGQGDPLRTAFIKTEENFDNIWLAGPVGSNITIVNNTIGVQNTNGNLALAPNGVGVIQARNAILPWIDSVYDLGGPNNYWRDIYVSSVTASGLIVFDDLTVGGNLTVQGDIIELGNIVTDSKIIHLANTAATPSQANVSGIVVGANSNIATFLWYANGYGWTSNNNMTIDDGTLSVISNTGNGNTWSMGGTSLSAPTGASWISNKQFLTEYIQSAPGGYIDIATLQTGNVYAQSTSLHIDQDYFEFTLYDGVDYKWSFNNTGNTSFPNYTFPADDGLSGQALITDGVGNVYWGTVSPAGANREIQFNDGGSFGSSGNLTFNKTGNILFASSIAANFLDVSQSGDSWTIGGDTITAPTGATWISNKQYTTEYIQSAPGGYIDIATLQTGNVYAQSTSLHIDQDYFEFTLYDGIDYKWSFNNTGNTSFPNYTFPADDGGTSQALLTDGSGTLYWGNVSNYGNANVVAYAESGWAGNIIPTGNAVYSLGNSTNQWANLWIANNTIYIGGVPLGITVSNVLTINGEPILSNDSDTSITTTGNISAGNVSIQSDNIALGNLAGSSGQGDYAVAIGRSAGADTQGTYAVAIGYDAGAQNQATGAVAVGRQAGQINQGTRATAAGLYAGYTDQGYQAVALGWSAGYDHQGDYAIAIGSGAGRIDQANNSIILNATGDFLNQSTANSFTVKPIRNAGTTDALYYDSTTGEITYNTLSAIANGTSDVSIATANGAVIVNVDDLHTWTFDTDGSLALPANAAIIPGAGNTITLVSGEGGQTELRSPDQYSNIWVDDYGVHVGTDWAVGAYQWNFDSTGNLALPSNTASINYANGVSILDGIGANLGNFIITNNTFENAYGGSFDNGTGGAGATARLSLPSATGTNSVMLENSYGNITVGTGTNGTVGNSWVFDDSGNLNYPDGTISTGGATFAAASSSVQMISNNAYNQVRVDDANVEIYTSLNGIVLKEWLFDGTGTLSLPGNINASTHYINNLSDPFDAQDAATKNYVDTVAQGLHIHNSCNVATTQDLATYTGATVTYNNGAGGVGATLTFSGNTLIDIDGYSLAAADRILVKNESNAVFNGIYVYSNNTALTRATDFDTDAEAAGGDFVFVTSGNVNADTGWVQTTDTPSIGNSNIVWQQFSAAGTYTANTAAGLVLNGSQFNAKVDNESTAFDAGGNIVVKPGGNLSVNSISATGNVTGNYILGNGSQLTGVISSYGDSNVSSLLASFGPNTISTSGNVTAANFIGNVSGVTANVDILASTYTWSFDNTGNLTLPGNTFAVNYANGTAVALGGGGGTPGGANTQVQFNDDSTFGGTAGLTFDKSTNALATTGTVSSTGNITAGNLRTGGAVTATGNIQGGNLLTGGLVSSTGNVTAGNILTGGVISATGLITSADGITATANLTAGNVVTTGLVSASGNVTGNYLFGNISQTTGGYGNANVVANLAALSSNPVSTTGNVTAGNFITGGLITATGNVTGGNVLATNDLWTSGNLRTTGSIGNLFNFTATTVNIGGGATGNVNIGNASGIVNLVGNVQGSTNGFAIGYRDIPQVSFAANATISVTDAGKHYYSTSASNLVFTIANNASQAFSTGATINIINQGTGTITVARGTGVTLYLAGNSTSSDRTISTYGLATVTKVATDTWFIVGAGVS